MSRKCKNRPVRQFRVMLDGFVDYHCNAVSRGQAKWLTFKAARDAGYFTDQFSRRDDGFRRFLQRGVRASEVRR